MPGAPGSSRRCEQCRQRKKKCGLEFPECTRCVKSGLRCNGARTTDIYVHRDASNLQHTSHRVALFTALRGRDQPSNQIAVRNDATSQDIVSPSTLRKEDELAIDLTHSVYYSVVDEFKPKRYHLGMFSADRAGHGQLSSFALCARSLISLVDMNLPVVDLCLFSVFTFYLGLRREDPSLIQYARTSYVSALKQFNLFISSRLSTAQHSSHLYGLLFYLSMALFLFEYVDSSTQSPALKAHLRGSSEVLRLAGPRAFRSDGAKQALAGFRGLVISLDVRDKSPSLFSQPTWAFQDVGIIKSPRDFLLDIGAQLSVLLHEADLITSGLLSPSEQERSPWNAIKDFQTAISVVEKELRLWFRTIQDSVSGLLYWELDSIEELSATFWDSYDPVCIPQLSASSIILCFPNGSIAGLLVTYWGYMLELSMAVMLVEDTISTAAPATGANSTPEEAKSSLWYENFQAAREEARLIMGGGPYLASCLEGALVLKEPLAAARRFLCLWNKHSAIS